MENFVAYHNVRRMGREYLLSDEPGFLSSKIGLLKKAIGNKVWVVQGAPQGGKTAFSLHGSFIAESVEPQAPGSDVHVISGKRATQFLPPLALNDLDWFPSLYKSQTNFSLGFNRSADQTVLDALAALESATSQPSDSEALPDVDCPPATTEGAARFVRHLRRERNRSIVDAKRASVMRAKGRLSCEVCSFDFTATYGLHGEGFCEVHHLTALSAANDTVNTELADLAVLCSNCHRIIHRTDPMLSVAEMWTVIQNERAKNSA